MSRKIKVLISTLVVALLLAAVPATAALAQEGESVTIRQKAIRGQQIHAVSGG